MVCFGQSNALIINLPSIHTMVTHTVNSHKGLKGELCHLNVNKRFTLPSKFQITLQHLLFNVFDTEVNIPQKMFIMSSDKRLTV